jgi:hypothetical protein
MATAQAVAMMATSKELNAACAMPPEVKTFSYQRSEKPPQIIASLFVLNE